MNKKYIDFVPAKRANKAIDSARQEDESSVHVKIGAPVKASVAAPVSEISEGVFEETSVEEVGAAEANVDYEEIDDSDELSLEEIFVESERPAEATAKPKYGVIEDFKPRFLKTDVQKRPLSHQAKSEDADIDIAKSKKIAAKVPFALRKKPKAAGVAVSPEVKVSDKAEPKVSSEVKVSDKAELKVSSEGMDKILDEALSEAEKVTNREKKPIRNTPFVNTEKVEKRPLSRNVYTKKVVVPEEEPSGPVTIIQKPEKDSRVGLVVAIVITIILGATAGTVAFLLLPK